MAIKITGTFEPSGEFPLVKDIDLQGSFRVIDNVESRDNIPQDNRKWGMVVYVSELQKFFQLLPENSDSITDNQNWIELKFGNSNLNWYITQAL